MMSRFNVTIIGFVYIFERLQNFAGLHLTNIVVTYSFLEDNQIEET